MAANDPRIKLTVRIDRELYLRLRDYCLDIGSTHNEAIVRCVEAYLSPQVIKCAKNIATLQGRQVP